MSGLRLVPDDMEAPPSTARERNPTNAPARAERSVHRILEDRGLASARSVALAIREGGAWRELTYADLTRRVRAVSADLGARSIGAGDRVAILSESRPEWAIAFLGAVRNGAIVVPLDPKLSLGELGPILEDAKPRLLFVSKRHVDTAVELSRSRPAIESVVLLQEDARHGEIPTIEAFQQGSPDRTNPTEREPKLTDCAVIAYTSGTTGKPKGVMLSYQSLVFQADCFEREFGVGPGDVLLSILPLNHTLELTCGLLSVLHAGGQVCYCESLFPAEISEAMRERRATRMLTVPLFLRTLQRGIESQVERSGRGRAFRFARAVARALPSQRLRRALFRRIHENFGGRLGAFHSGGAPLDRHVAEFFDTIGLPVFEGYGMTESSPVIATNTPAHHRLGSVGREIPGTEVRIAREGDDDDGEIVVRGPHVMLGYYGQEELTREVIDRDGWLHTGDLGRIDADGFVYVTGRSKSLIVLPTGKKVQPEEVEAVLAASPHVKEVCVLGRIPTKESGSKDSGAKGSGPRGEEVEAVAVPSDSLRREMQDDLARIRAAIEADFATRLQAIAAFKRPARIHVLTEDLPKTTTGKVRRRDVVRILDGGSPRSSGTRS